MDRLFCQSGLLSHRLLAYLDYVVFFADSRSKLRQIITKLQSLQPLLSLNYSKWAILTTQDCDRD